MLPDCLTGFMPTISFPLPNSQGGVGGQEGDSLPV